MIIPMTIEWGFCLPKGGKPAPQKPYLLRVSEDRGLAGGSFWIVGGGRQAATQNQGWLRVCQ